MSVTYGSICAVVANAFRDKPGIQRVMNYDELTESIVDTPLLHVYGESGAVDAGNSNDRTTFGAGVRQTEFVITMDGYARRRSHLAEDLKAQMEMIDVIDAVLVATTKPLFGEAAIKGLSWKWERVTLAYGNTQEMGGPREQYAGCRFTITLRIF